MTNKSVLDVRPYWALLRSIGGSAVLGLIVAAGGAVGEARAQSLDSVVVSLLSENCRGLGQLDYDDDGTIDVGSRLAAICAFPSTVGGSSAGGGAASIQSSGVSIKNALVQSRLRRARGEKQDSAGNPNAIRYASLLLSRGVAVDSADLLPPAPASSEGDAFRDRRFGVVFSGMYESLDRELTPLEDAYDSSVKGGALVADYRFTDAFVGGVAVGYTSQNGDFLSGGDFTTKTLDTTIFASVLPSQSTFVEIVGGYQDQSFDTTRNARFDTARPDFVDPDPDPVSYGGRLSSDTDASVLTGGVTFGYDYAAGSVTIGPRLGANYARSRIDSFAERGGTGLELQTLRQTVKSLQGVVGLAATVAISTGKGVLVPKLGVEYIHEFEDDPRFITARFAEDLRPNPTTFRYQVNTPDSSFFTVEAGLVAVFANGVQPFVSVRAMLGNDVFDSVAGTVGIRF